MKTTCQLSIHKTFEKGLNDKRQIVWYISDGKKVERLPENKIEKFSANLKAGTVLRFTTVNPTDAEILRLMGQGCEIQYANWHTLGIEKNLGPEEIAAALSKADSSVFRTFIARPDIAELRSVLAARNAVLKFYGDSVRKLKQIGRNAGEVAEPEKLGFLSQSFEQLDNFMEQFNAVNEKGKSVSLDTKLAQVAAKIPECALFNKIAGINGSWVSAASIVAYTGSIERFPTVAAFWHYFGQHVIDGQAPKRKVGQPVTWSPAGRTAVYLLGDSLIKNMKNPWREFYDEAKAQELAVHAEKHPNCPAVLGHCGARARRKMCKEILKQFYLAATGQEYRDGQPCIEIQNRCAVAAGL